MQEDISGPSDQRDGQGLRSNTIDLLTAAAKGLLGAVPVVGSLHAEFAGVVIPNQRLDRVTRFAEQLHRRLSAVETQLLGEALKDPEFGDIAEESMRQAASSLTEERRAYLAAAVSEALDPARRSYADSRQVLRLLSQVSDLQVIVMRSYLVATLDGDDSFRARHEGVLEPVAVTLGSGQDVGERAALWMSHREHLERLGLLERNLKVDGRTKQPIFNAFEKRFETTGFGLTQLGRLVLRTIGLTSDGFAPVESDLTDKG